MSNPAELKRCRGPGRMALEEWLSPKGCPTTFLLSLFQTQQATCLVRVCLVRNAALFSFGKPTNLQVSVFAPGTHGWGRGAAVLLASGPAPGTGLWGKGSLCCGGGRHGPRVHCDSSPLNGLGGSRALDLSAWKGALVVDARFGPILQAPSEASCVFSELKE